MSVMLDMPIFYSALAVTDGEPGEAYNRWQRQHVGQGFAWRPGSVSFATLEDAGDQRVEVQFANEVSLRPDAERAILVPFTVSASEHIGISNMVEDQFLEVPAGKYALVFQTGYGDNGILWSTLTFVPENNCEAEILRADEGLTPAYPLLMNADPA